MIRNLWLLVLVVSASLPRAFAQEGDAQFAVSPESAFGLLDSAIRDAKESIVLNVYMLTNKNITQDLADKAQSGVTVTVLIEGETYGGEMLTPVKRVLDDLYLRFNQQSEGRGKFLVMTSQNGSVQRRYVFDHAKYMVIDGKKAFISSENITGSAFNNKNLTGGTRGWEIYLESTPVAQALTQIFTQDTDPSNADVIPYNQAPFKLKDPGNSPLPDRSVRDVTSFAKTSGKFSSAAVCASPQSLDCIVKFIRSAKRDLSVEHLSLPLYWKDGAKKVNPIVAEVIAAAKRGVNVRVLLNDDASFGGDTGNVSPEDKNTVTVDYLRAQGVQAAIFNYKAVEVNYVHNKGMVADGARVFVGSINGTQNAVENNREVGVAVESADAAKFYGSVFDFDWNQSAK